MHQEGPHYTVCAGVLSTEYKSTPQFSTPYSEPWAFSDTSSWHPLREVTIETGQSACDRPKSETARIVWNPIAALASIYKVIHSFWQRLLSPWTPHFHENQQNAPAQRTEWYSEDTGIKWNITQPYLVMTTLSPQNKSWQCKWRTKNPKKQKT